MGTTPASFLGVAGGTRSLTLRATLVVGFVGCLAAVGSCATEGSTPRARHFLQSAYGINIHAPVGRDAERVLDRVAAAGIGWVRIDVNWEMVEAWPGRYEWARFDGLVRAARARDIEVLGVLAYSPGWATDGPATSGVPRDPAQWERFCATAARRYRGSVRAWELWNEPNNERFWSGSREQYWEVVLLPGARGIRAGDPDALVVGPALAHLQSGRWPRWLGQTVEQHGELLDVLSHHVYHREAAGAADRLAAAREVIEAAGGGELPVWITEIGWESPDEEEQAERYREFLALLHAGDPRLSWVSKFFFYEIRDAPGVEPWGLLRADGTPKPAYRVMQEALGSLPVSPGLE